MLGRLATVLAVAGLSCVQAEVYKCDKLQQPNYDSCTTIMNGLDWNQGVGGLEINDGGCAVWSEPGNVGNCVVAACNYRGDGGVSYMNTFSGPTEYQLLEQHCKPDNAGGVAPPDYYARISVSNNPNYKPGSSAIRAARGQVVSTMMTIEEFKAFEEQGKQVSEGNVATRSASLRKRAPEWLKYGESKNIRRDGQRSRMSAVSGSGASQQWSTEKGYSTSVATSASMGVDFFKIFSASVEITVTQEFSVSYTYTLGFDASNKCDPSQSAVLYFYPLFDEYVGAFQENGNIGETQTVWIPVEGQNNYELQVECLG